MRASLMLLLVGCLLTPLNVLAMPTDTAPATWQRDHAPQDEATYFPETGYWVSEPFRSFWEAQGGLLIFGYPISRVFYQDGLHRQYFERAVFEWHEDLAGTPYEVLLMRLGALGTRDRRDEPPFQPLPADTQPDDDCDFFPATGHQLCGDFRAYWRTHGGLATFGYPLSEEFVEGDYVVQYFERARFEYHPENEPPFDILLGHMGRETLDARRVPTQAITPESPDAAPAPPLGPQPLYNHDVHCGFTIIWWGDIFNLRTNEYFLDRAQATGCKWLRLPGAWHLLEPEPGRYEFNPLDVVIREARERDLKLLVTISGPPEWAFTPNSGVPADPERFARFMGAIARHFRGRVDAWQLWNEPNLDYEAGGLIDPAGYLAMLREAAPAVRKADPDALIVLAGLAPNSLNYVDWAVDDTVYLETLLGLNEGEVRNYIDVIAIHNYSGGNPPDTYWPGNPADTPRWNDAPEFYFRHAEEIHRVLVSTGFDDFPVWATEFGWTTKNAWPDYGYGDWVSMEDQARYITRGYEIARTEWPWMKAMFVFNLNAAVMGGESSPYYGFSILDKYGQPRPAYDAITAMSK